MYQLPDGSKLYGSIRKRSDSVEGQPRSCQISRTPRSQAGGGYIVAQNSPVDDLGEEGCLGHQVMEQMWNIFLT